MIFFPLLITGCFVTYQFQLVAKITGLYEKAMTISKVGLYEVKSFFKQFISGALIAIVMTKALLYFQDLWLYQESQK